MTPKLPAKANPLARLIGERLRLIRRGRKLTRDVVAKELGISLMHYVYIETGRQLPDPLLSDRLYNWALLGTRYSSHPLAVAKREASAITAKERVLRVTMTKADSRRLGLAADRLGLSQDALAELFIIRGLDNTPALAVMSDAVVAINKARMSQAMRDSPEMRDLLLADLGVAIAAGSTGKELEATRQVPAQRLATALDFDRVEVLDD